MDVSIFRGDSNRSKLTIRDTGDDGRGIVVSIYAGDQYGYSDHQALAEYEYGQAGKRTEIFG